MRLHARGGVGLDGDALQAAFVGEVVDVGGAEVGADGAGDGGDVHALRVGGIAVDVEAQLRRVFHAVRAHLGDLVRLLCCHAEQLVARGEQRFVAGVAAVFQHEVEAVGDAERGDGRRAQGDDGGVADAHEHADEAAAERFRTLVRLGTLFPVFQGDEGESHVLSLTAEAEALDGDDVFDFRLLFQEGFHLLDFFDGALGGGACGQLDAGDDKALVFVGEEVGRQAAVDVHRTGGDGEVHHKHRIADADEFGDGGFVGMGEEFDHAVEPAEEAAFFVVVVAYRFEQGGAERGGEGQRQETGEADGACHDEGELAVDVTGRATKEGHRHEDDDVHQGDADDGARYLSHAFARRLVGGEFFFGHQAFDVFDDDDGVIHHNPDNQDHREHGEHVDTHAQRAHQRDRAQKRDGHDDGRDEGVAQVLQEEEHDDEDQHYRLKQGMQYLVDGEVDEGGTVIRR